MKPVRAMGSLLLTVLFATALASAGDATELTFSASLFNPNEGGTSWDLAGEVLFPLGPFVAGPSVKLFEGPGMDGGAAGVAIEANLGKTCGPALGVALHKLTGDAADQAAYTGEARAIFKCGSERAFVKLTASQVWSRAEDGAVTDPDGTSLVAGLGIRFGK